MVGPDLGQENYGGCKRGTIIFIQHQKVKEKTKKWMSSGRANIEAKNP